MNTQNGVMIVAGDPSGDQHAGQVLAALHDESVSCEAWGVGGPAMVAQGFQEILPFHRFNRMGFGEILTQLPFFFHAKKTLASEMDLRKPAVVVLVDYAGFNMQILSEAARRNIPVVWYIVPKVWVWKKYRARVIGEKARAIATILPFETSWFSDFCADTRYVGNPSVERVDRRKKEFNWHPRRYPSSEENWRLAIAPGSRTQEIRSLVRPMLEAAHLCRQKYPRLEVRVSRAGSIDLSELKSLCTGHAVDIHDGPLDELFLWSNIALVTSGTATLESALMGVPLVLAYRTSALNVFLGRLLTHITYIGLPNIIAQREIVPECIQKDASPSGMADRLMRFMDNREVYDRCLMDLESLDRQLGHSRPSREVARKIASFLA